MSDGSRHVASPCGGRAPNVSLSRSDIRAAEVFASWYREAVLELATPSAVAMSSASESGDDARARSSVTTPTSPRRERRELQQNSSRKDSAVAA